MKKIKSATLLLLCGAILAGASGCSSKNETAQGEPTLTWYVIGENQSDQAAVIDEVNKITAPFFT